MTADNQIGNQAVHHKIIRVADQDFVVQIDRTGEIVKMWEAGPRSQAILDASANLKKQNTEK